MANQSKKYAIPMEVTEETITDFGIDRKEVKAVKMRGRKIKCIFVPSTKEQYLAYMQPLEAEWKQDEREGRCRIKGKSGKLVRCPESNKCENCPYGNTVVKEINKPASMEYLTEKNLEPSYDNFEDGVLYDVILKSLIQRLASIKPVYGEIFQMMYDQRTQKAMKEELGIPQRTLSDHIKKIRSILKPVAKKIFDR